MQENAVENALDQVKELSLTVDAQEMEEITRIVMLAPRMSEKEAADFISQVNIKGIRQLREEMSNKQFLIKCFRAAAYFGNSQFEITEK